LQLEAIHFEHWLQHFIHTTNQMFEGPNANTAIERVKLLASTFMYKLHGEYKDFNQIQ
jgi:truncated hemoglobin YjbI